MSVPPGTTRKILVTLSADVRDYVVVYPSGVSGLVLTHVVGDRWVIVQESTGKTIASTATWHGAHRAASVMAHVVTDAGMSWEWNSPAEIVANDAVRGECASIVRTFRDR